MIDYIVLFYRKHKEVLLYLFFGVLTFLLSVASYWLMNVQLGINELIANLLSWVLAVLLAFFTNRTWVFQSSTQGSGEFLQQMFTFLSGRMATLFVEEAILAVFITWLGCDSMLVKLIAQILVIVLNYVISKLVVFRRHTSCTEKER